MRPRTVIPLVLALFTMLVAGCGGSDDERASGSSSKPSRADPTAQAESDGPQHIHGLGVQGDTLFIATHTGLWAAADGQTKARRVGSSKQDIMGFSVLSRGRFIGSGHPDPTQGLPPNLGLIESRDRGKTWKNVSLEGQADFHTLESAGARVYGFDGTQGRLMVSPDGGRSWTQRTPPAAIFSRPSAACFSPRTPASGSARCPGVSSSPGFWRGPPRAASFSLTPAGACAVAATAEGDGSRLVPSAASRRPSGRTAATSTRRSRTRL